MKRRHALTLPLLLLVAGPAVSADVEALRAQVEATERAFARTLAQRDAAGFESFLSEQTVFYGTRRVMRGKAEVMAVWKTFFDGPDAPFSWEPDQVDVLADGTLAHSSGPVRDPQGKLISRFNSVWRQEAPGVWRVVFDKGSPLSEEERRRAAAPAN